MRETATEKGAEGTIPWPDALFKETESTGELIARMLTFPRFEKSLASNPLFLE